jgi:hypothetical protein
MAISPIKRKADKNNDHRVSMKPRTKLLGILNEAAFHIDYNPPLVSEKLHLEYNTFRPHSSLKYRPPAPEVYLN